MKLDQQFGDTSVQTTGGGGGNYGIDESKKSMIIHLLSQYSNPIESVVREITSNCFDAHEEAKRIPAMTDEELVKSGYGSRNVYEAYQRYKKKVADEASADSEGLRKALQKDVEDAHQEFKKLFEKENSEKFDEIRSYFSDWKERDVEIELVKNQTWGTDSSSGIIFRDFGVGLSPLRFEVIVTNYLTSTKNDTNDFIGAFGLGSKSPLGYTNSFRIITRYMGTEYEYIIWKGAETPEYDLIRQEETNKRNGTEVVVDIERNDFYDFKKAVRRQLAYFENIKFLGAIDIDNEYKIYRGENFLYRTDTPFDQVHLCLGRVYYPLDFSAIGMGSYGRRNHNCPIALWFDVGELSIMWNRENVQYDDETKRIIQERLKEAKEELAQMGQKKYDEIDNLQSYLIAATDRHKQSIKIADGVHVKNGKKIVDINVRYPKYEALNSIPRDPFFDFSTHRRVQDGKITSRSDMPNVRKLFFHAIGRSTNRLRGVNVDGFILKDSYSSKKNRYISEVGDSNICSWKDVSVANGYRDFYLIKENQRFGWTDEDMLKVAQNYFGYNLRKYTKPEDIPDGHLDLMRDYRREAIKLMYEAFNDYSDYDISDEYRKWEREKRKRRREKRKEEEGDNKIPIKELVWDTSYPSEYSWKMDKMKIADIMDYTGLIIYGHQNDDEKLCKWAHIVFAHSKLVKENKRRYGTPEIKQLRSNRAMILKVAKSNAKYIEEAANGMHLDDFLKPNSKLISRYATAGELKSRLPEGFNILNCERMSEIHKGVRHSAHFVESYIQTYYDSNFATISDEMLESLVKMCTEAKTLDYEAIKHYKNARNFLRKYPLLKSVDLQSADLEELMAYMNSKGPVHFNLYYRLQKHKEDDKNN